MPASSRPKLSPFDEEGRLNVVIETPKESRAKYALHEETGLFEMRFPLPAGQAFPFDFGFIPGTRGDDGDPLDVLVLCDAPASMGALVRARLLGVLRARQAAKGEKMERNDRLLAVQAESLEHANSRNVGDISPALKRSIEEFFIGYNRLRGKRFKPLGWRGKSKARKLVEAAAETGHKRRARRR